MMSVRRDIDDPFAEVVAKLGVPGGDNAGEVGHRTPESIRPDESGPRSKIEHIQSTTPCSIAEKPGAAPATPVYRLSPAARNSAAAAVNWPELGM
jgi:hypothetical protein